jgi:hypothetical protein
MDSTGFWQQAPISYNVYLDGVRIATGISLVHHLVGWMRNSGSTPQTHTWYIDAINPMRHTRTHYVLPRFSFTINPCCIDATATIGLSLSCVHSRTSCADAPISFIIVPSGASALNHARTYLRVFVRHASAAPNLFNILGTHTSTLWHGDTITVRWSPIANGDSVTVFLDSLFHPRWLQNLILKRALLSALLLEATPPA